MSGTTDAAIAKIVSFQDVCLVRHWTDELFSLRLTRPEGLRFRSGEHVMIGVMDSDRPLMRPYSIVSPAWDDELEFFARCAEDCVLGGRLRRLGQGDQALVARKSSGALLLDALKPGRRLFLFSSGAGLAPFASVLRDPETYERFECVVVTQSCRAARDLDWGRALIDQLSDDPVVGDRAPAKTHYYASVTREPYPVRGRITELIASERMFDDLRLPGFDAHHDRAMICGAPAMVADVKALLEGAGFSHGSEDSPGDYATERTFGERRKGEGGGDVIRVGCAHASHARHSG